MVEIVHFSDIHMNRHAMSLVDETDGNTLHGCICAVTGDMYNTGRVSDDKIQRAQKFFEKLCLSERTLWVPGNHDCAKFRRVVFDCLDAQQAPILHAAPWTKAIGNLLFFGVDAKPGLSDPSDIELASQLRRAIDLASEQEMQTAGGYVVLTHFRVKPRGISGEQLRRLTSLRPTLVLYGHHHPHSFSGLPTFSWPDEYGESNLWSSWVVSSGKTRDGNRVVAQSIVWNGSEFHSERELYVNLRGRTYCRGWREAGTGDEAERERLLDTNGIAEAIARRRAKRLQKASSDNALLHGLTSKEGGAHSVGSNVDWKIQDKRLARLIERRKEEMAASKALAEKMGLVSRSGAHQNPATSLESDRAQTGPFTNLADRYFYCSEKKREPEELSTVEIVERVEADRDLNHLVWKKGMKDWQSAKEMLCCLIKPLPPTSPFEE